MSAAALAGPREDVVWWSDTGKVLHRNPDCPPFLRARWAALKAMEAGDYERGVRIRSYDFHEDSFVSASEGGSYPPQWMMPCRLCAW